MPSETPCRLTTIIVFRPATAPSDASAKDEKQTLPVAPEGHSVVVDTISSEFLERVSMRKLNTGLTIFILFFGVALIEAFEKHNWLEAALFLLLGVVSVLADRKRSQ